MATRESRRDYTYDSAEYMPKATRPSVRRDKHRLRAALDDGLKKGGTKIRKRQIFYLNFRLEGAALVPTMRKPFDVLVEAFYPVESGRPPMHIS